MSSDPKEPFVISDDISPITSKKVTANVELLHEVGRDKTYDNSIILETSGILHPTSMSEFDPFRQGFKAFGEDTFSKVKQAEHGSFLKTNDKKVLLSSSASRAEISTFQGATEKKKNETKEATKKKPQKIKLLSPSPMSQKEGFDLSAPTPKVEVEK